MRYSRSTARVLPVDPGGRVLLLLGRDLFGGRRFWLSVGGGIERGETPAEAGARELREETGISVDAAGLGAPLGTSSIESQWFRLLRVREHLVYFAAAVEETRVSFAGQGRLERATIDGYSWVTPEALATRPERLSDPELPQMMHAAVAAARAARPGPVDC